MGGFGAPDRGGSREGKKSLRGNKQALQKLVKDEQKGHVKSGPKPTLSEKPPPALAPSPGGHAIVDAAAQLASRQFDRDQFKVLQRAASAGVGPIICYTTDDQKLDALCRTSKENGGCVYFLAGVHSDNIKKANDRLSPARLEQLRDLALEPGCVGVLGGLAFRDVGIRYAQERALAEQMELAAGVGLPLVLYEVRAADALAERISEFRSGGSGEGRSATTPIAIFNFSGSREELDAYLGLGCHIVLTGRVCDPTERGEQLRELVAAIPPDRLLLASDAPFATPQNIPDVFVREGRNEPSNLPYVLEALAAPLGLTAAELAAATRRNTLAFFGIQEAAEAEADAAAAAAVAAAAPAAALAGPAAAAAPPPAASSAAGGKASKSQKGRAAGAERSPGAMKGPRRDQEEEQEEGQQEEASGEEAAEDTEEEEEEEEEEGGAGASSGRAGRAANLFALMELRDEEEEEEGDEEEEDGAEEEGGAGRARRGADASTSRPAIAGGADAGGADAGGGGGKPRSSKPPPRNFVAEYEAAAAARGSKAAAGGGGRGPRVSYSCRGCRSVLFTEADTEPHGEEERALFAATKPRRKGRGRQGNDGEGSLCSMHFLRRSLPWMESCLHSEGQGGGEGKLICPTCCAKLGKWATGPGAGGVQCSCGVLVAAPAYALLKARLDILDAQLDIASAVQSSLKAYEEGEAGGGGDSSSSSGDEAPGSRKKRQKQKRNKTANFSSFRNKNFGFRLKEQRQLAESVTTTAGGAAVGGEGGSGGGGGGSGATGLGTVREASN